MTDYELWGPWISEHPLLPRRKSLKPILISLAVIAIGIGALVGLMVGR